ncbi:hypothetical protein LEM8419_03061 [Neolewinella maritima]|uniref:Aspartate kinase n=1 Tax=Neolewinella maritima TaxID=1383882 RepID=A0ABM9B475_9BACT|nr:ACT domain-containing protein [Neolewinella maritima]CAH1002144.1 hypothetical protein LEM8419_03061 [Neolewinella maritima]
MTPPDSGELRLEKLLAEMCPMLNEGRYAFVTLPSDSAIPRETVAMVQEAEGMSLIVPAATADKLGLAYSGAYSWITLQVHSSLAAVGLTAAVANALTAHEISCNVVAGTYHDHLFVACSKETRAMTVLTNMTQGT